MRQGAVWLASYPKSGNTWLRCLLQGYLTGHVDINRLSVSKNDLDLTAYQLVCAEPVTQMEPGAMVYYRPAALMNMIAQAGDKTPMFKTHHLRERVNGIDLIPPLLTRCAVYIVRDPRDVAISMAEHVGRSLDEIIDLMNRPEYILQREGSGVVHFVGSWSKHVNTWASAPFPVHTVRYEDLLDHPVKVFGQLLADLGMNPDPDRVEEAVDLSLFGNLRDQEQAQGFTETSEHQQQFFTRGTAGHWQDILTGKQVRRIEQDHGAVMRQYGYLDEARRASGG